MEEKKRFKTNEVKETMRTVKYDKRKYDGSIMENIEE